MYKNKHVTLKYSKNIKINKIKFAKYINYFNFV